MYSPLYTAARVYASLSKLNGYLRIPGDVTILTNPYIQQLQISHLFHVNNYHLHKFGKRTQFIEVKKKYKHSV